MHARIRTGATEMSEPIIQSFLQDFRYGVRILRKSPGFSAIAILSLALGIMAATAMYSVIYGVVLNPFPYRDVDSLMSVKIWSPDQSGYRVGYTVDQFLEIAERNTIFEGVIASTISDVLWSSQGEPQRLRGNVCTMNAFEVMGVPPPHRPHSYASGCRARGSIRRGFGLQVLESPVRRRSHRAREADASQRNHSNNYRGDAAALYVPWCRCLSAHNLPSRTTPGRRTLRAFARSHQARRHARKIRT